MICHKVLFSKDGIKTNIACFSIIPTVLLKIIVILIFYKNQINKITNKISDIIFGIYNWEFAKEDLNEKELIEKKNKKRQQFLFKPKYIFKTNNRPRYFIKTKNNKIVRLPTTFHYNYKYNKLNNYNNYQKQNKDNFNNFMNKAFHQSNLSENYKLNTVADNNQSIIKKTKEIMSFNDEEMNSLSYELALKYDNRRFCAYYLSLLKTKHIIFFTFCYKNDYNLRIIKIDLFIINFIIGYNINALFFNDDTMHKIYEDQGSFNFIYQLPQIVYSTLISTAINTLLSQLALSEENILEFKKNKAKTNLDKRAIDLNKKLNFKFGLYFVISSIILFFSWYYLSMFGAIYRKTQYHLIKDTLISFGLSILYPFGIYFLPGIFRIPALSNKKNYFYKVSLLFQML